MGKAEDERLAIAVHKYPYFYDNAIPAFHNKNEKENAWESVGKDLGFETVEAEKNTFTSLRTKCVRQKKT